MLLNLVAVFMKSCKSWPMRIIKYEMAHFIKQISKSMRISWTVNGNFMVDNWKFYGVDEIWWICDEHGDDRLASMNMNFSISRIGGKYIKIGMANVNKMKMMEEEG